MPKYTQGDPAKHAIEVWIKYLNSLLWAPWSLNDSANKAFLRAANPTLGLDQQFAINEVAGQIKDAGGELKIHKLRA